MNDARKRISRIPTNALAGLLSEVFKYRLPLRVSGIRQYQTSYGKAEYYICPRCGEAIEREYTHFCDRCGQRLSW